MSKDKRKKPALVKKPVKVLKLDPKKGINEGPLPCCCSLF